MVQLTKEQAVAFYESEAWKEMSNKAIAEFQLFQDLLCVPFGKFHEAMEEALGRPVFTHEFAFRDGLVKEFLGDKSAPTLSEIIGLIPEDKQVLIMAAEPARSQQEASNNEP